MKISVRRVYDAPRKTEGTRMLVDRLWPRGVTKKKARVDVWAKELAPSNELRKWFHKNREGRENDFRTKYRAELTKNKKVIKKLLGGTKHVTLVTAVRDVSHSHVPVLKAFLEAL